jgi:hypothetical protein
MFILSNTLPNLSKPDMPSPELLPTHHETVSGKPATLLTPSDLFFFLWQRSFTVPGAKKAPIPY